MKKTNLHHQAPALLVTLTLLTLGTNPADAALVGHWTFDDATTTTTLLDDVSTAGADNNGGQSAGTAVVGGAGFIGSGSMEMFGSQTISVGSSADFDATSWTASMWLNSDVVGGGLFRTAFGSWDSSLNFHIGLNNTGKWDDYGGGVTAAPDLAIVGTWYHIVSVRTPNLSENAIWVNGVKYGTSTGAPTASGLKDAFIGSKDSAGGNPWDGKIDDLAYFNEALTDEQIGLIYNGGLAGKNVVQALAPVPEPSAFALLGLGGFALLLRRRRA